MSSVRENDVKPNGVLQVPYCILTRIINSSHSTLRVELMSDVLTIKDVPHKTEQTRF